MFNAQCQDCQNTKSPPVGMVHWPTDEDDYICIVCLRERFAKRKAELEAAKEIMRGFCINCEQCDKNTPSAVCAGHLRDLH